MRFQANDLNFGVSIDMPAWNLPPGVMTDSLNMRYVNGAAEKMGGWQTALGDLSVTATSALAYLTDESLNVYYVYGDTKRLWATDGSSTHVAIIPEIHTGTTSYDATLDLGWNGDPYNNFFVFTDGGEGPLTKPPLSWVPASISAGTAVAVELVNWPASTTCNLIRSFRNFLVALRVDEGSGTNPLLLRWSSSTYTGLPSSWDYTDPANDSGRVTIADTDDPIIDCLPLRGTNIVYKEQHTWAMEYIGGSTVFAFREIFSEIGLITENCVAAFKNMHFVVGNNDVVVHDGNEAQSVVDRKTRNWLFNQIDADNYKRCFVITDDRNSEMIFCYPTEGESFADRALVWNWQSNSVYPRDLGGNMARGAYGRMPVGFSRAVYADRNTAEVYGLMTRADEKEAVIFAGSEVYDTSVAMSVYAERKNIPLNKDINSVKRILRVYPWVEGTDGDTLKVQLYTKDALSDATRTTASATFVIGQDYKTDFRVDSRTFDIRFVYGGANEVKVYGYDIDYFRGGER